MLSYMICVVAHHPSVIVNEQFIYNFTNSEWVFNSMKILWINHLIRFVNDIIEHKDCSRMSLRWKKLNEIYTD